MATHYMKDKDGKVNAIFTMPDIYEYKGFTFEFHRYLGPVKLNKDWEPSKRQGKKFYDVFAEWNKLSAEEKKATQVAE